MGASEPVGEGGYRDGVVTPNHARMCSPYLLLRASPDTHRENERDPQAPPTHSENDPARIWKEEFERVMRNATGRWQQEAATRSVQVLDKLRRGLSLPDMTPSQREHVDTCMRCLDAALNCPTPHLDLSLLPPGHALSDEALDPFMQQRSMVSPPLRSITLPA